jgi:ABC-2 type transport system ATP-binding protein
VADSAVVIDGVSKRFRLYRERNQSLKAALMRGKRAAYEEFWALRDVSFEIPTGSTFGLIGENGSGKSTLLKCIARILRPESGSVRTAGSVAALLELGSGFHPEMSGRDNVYLNGSILGMKKAEIDRKFDEIVDFSGIEAFIDQPVKNYSSGMYVRLGFSVAINIDPDILLVDEVLAVGDASFQEKCMAKFAEFKRVGKTVVLVSHATSSVRAMCDRAAWLSHGEVQEVGDASDVVVDYVDQSHDTHIGLPRGGNRWGTGEARLEAVQVVNASGAVGGRLRSGEPLTVRLSYRADRPVRRPVFGLAIETMDGQTLWGTNTRESGLELETLDGVGTIDFRIPSLNLQGERLDLVAAITDHTTTHIYDFLRNCVPFDVNSARPVESGGPVSLSGEWSALKAGDQLEPRPFAMGVEIDDAGREDHG